jgi:hypothetical protein
MGRFSSLLRDMEGHGRLPSSHDLEVYGWGGTVGGSEREKGMAIEKVSD